MKYKVFKRCTKKSNKIFTMKRKTKELQIMLDDVDITIKDHWYGLPLNDPYIIIKNKNGINYSMSIDVKNLIKKLNN